MKKKKEAEKIIKEIKEYTEKITETKENAEIFLQKIGVYDKRGKLNKGYR